MLRRAFMALCASLFTGALFPSSGERSVRRWCEKHAWGKNWSFAVETIRPPRTSYVRPFKTTTGWTACISPNPGGFDAVVRTDDQFPFSFTGNGNSRKEAIRDLITVIELQEEILGEHLRKRGALKKGWSPFGALGSEAV